jgi:hypothetical protein
MNMLNNLHSFKKHPLDGIQEQIVMKNNVACNLENVRWLNIYDGADPVSGHLDLYEVDKNIRYDMEAAFGVAHVKYWGFAPMYTEIFDFFAEELEIESVESRRVA